MRQRVGVGRDVASGVGPRKDDRVRGLDVENSIESNSVAVEQKVRGAPAVEKDFPDRGGLENFFEALFENLGSDFDDVEGEHGPGGAQRDAAQLAPTRNRLKNGTKLET